MTEYPGDTTTLDGSTFNRAMTYLNALLSHTDRSIGVGGGGSPADTGDRPYLHFSAIYDLTHGLLTEADFTNNARIAGLHHIAVFLGVLRVDPANITPVAFNMNDLNILYQQLRRL